LEISINEHSIARSQVTYGLQALLLHTGGSATSGHYEVVVKHFDTWFRCNDLRVYSIPMRNALAPSSATYMCIYTGCKYTFIDFSMCEIER